MQEEAHAEQEQAAEAGVEAGAEAMAEAGAEAEEAVDAVPSAEEALQAEVADWRDRCLRAAAEMENVRKRARQDAEDARRRANERLVSELLPVLDNFTRALEAQTGDLEALRSGVEMIHRQLAEVLTREGLSRIEAAGQPFDPNLHEAIMQVEPHEGQAPHEVVEELRAGYRLHDRVLRPTLVKVTAG